MTEDAGEPGGDRLFGGRSLADLRQTEPLLFAAALIDAYRGARLAGRPGPVLAVLRAHVAAVDTALAGLAAPRSQADVALKKFTAVAAEVCELAERRAVIDALPPGTPERAVFGRQRKRAEERLQALWLPLIEAGAAVRREE